MTTSPSRLPFLTALTAVAALGVSGCGVLNRSDESTPATLGGAEYIYSGFSETDLDGYVATPLTEVTQRRIRDNQGVGYSYKGGLDSNGDYRVVAGLIRMQDMTPPTFTGTANFSGETQALVANLDGTVSEVHSPVNLRADLNTGFFSGETRDTTNSNMQMIFVGSIVNGTMQGTGRVDAAGHSINTQFLGKVSDDRAVSVFQGQAGSVAVAGGLYTNRAP